MQVLSSPDLQPLILPNDPFTTPTKNRTVVNIHASSVVSCATTHIDQNTHASFACNPSHPHVIHLQRIPDLDSCAEHLGSLPQPKRICAIVQTVSDDL